MSNLQSQELLLNISVLLDNARKKVVSAVNQTMVITYFEIGRMIVKDEQNGESRAEYGKSILKDLSLHLTERFGKGFSQRNLEQMRQFYLSYSISQTPSAQLKISTNTIPQTLSAELQIPDNQYFENPETPSQNSFTKFKLSWSHYLKLMRISDTNERNFMKLKLIKTIGAYESCKDNMHYTTNRFLHVNISRFCQVRKILLKF